MWPWTPRTVGSRANIVIILIRKRLEIFNKNIEYYWKDSMLNLMTILSSALLYFNFCAVALVLFEHILFARCVSETYCLTKEGFIVHEFEDLGWRLKMVDVLKSSLLTYMAKWNLKIWDWKNMWFYFIRWGVCEEIYWIISNGCNLKIGQVFWLTIIQHESMFDQ